MNNTSGQYELQIEKSILQLTDEEGKDKLEAGYVFFNVSKFSHWRKLLDQWIENIKKFCLETDVKDNPYESNEMCNIGLLEAAAWMSDGIAKSEQPRKFKNGRGGRLDLWMKFPEYEKIELIEAKHTTNLMLNKKNGKRDKYDYNSLKEDLENRAKDVIEVKKDEEIKILLFLTFNATDKKLFSSHPEMIIFKGVC